jgi:hypothetical protein
VKRGAVHQFAKRLLAWLDRKMSSVPSPAPSSSIGIALGRFVDVELYDAIGAFATKLPTTDHQKAFGSAWNGLGYRARAAADYADAFRTHWAAEPASSAEARFEQEKAFYGFVTNACAAIESLVFAAYIVALGRAGKTPTSDDLDVGFYEMVACLKQDEVMRPLGKHFERLGKEPHAKSLGDPRDVLLHRGVLLRSHWVGGPRHGTVTVAANPKAVPGEWKPNFVLGPEAVDAWSDWLGRYVLGALPLLRQSLQAEK